MGDRPGVGPEQALARHDVPCRDVPDVPRAALGLAADDFRFDFKFVDSTVSCADPLDYYDHGVVVPLGRVAFHYHGTR